MNILCVICHELFTPSEDIVYTVCGHTYHSVCLTEWIKSSQSCPECRRSVTRGSIHKLYFNVSDNGISTNNDRQEWDKIKYLKAQIKLKEKDINYFMSKNATLEKQNAGFRKEVRKLENDIDTKIFAVQSINEEVEALKRQLSEYKKAKNIVTKLKKKMRFQRNIKVLLDVSVEDVIDIIGNDSRADLLTYVYQMKEEIVSNLSEMRHLKIKVKDLQNVNAKMIMRSDVLSQNYSSNRQLEEQCAFYESEKMALQSRVIELEKMLGSKRIDKKSKYNQPNPLSNWWYGLPIPLAILSVIYFGRRQISSAFSCLTRRGDQIIPVTTYQSFVWFPERVPELPVDAGIPFVFSSLARLGTLLIEITSDFSIWVARRFSSCLMFLGGQGIPFVFSSLARLGTPLIEITSDLFIWVARHASWCLMFLGGQGIPFVFSSLARLVTLLTTITNQLYWFAVSD